MKRRPLGRSGIEVAPFAFGGNVFGWTVDEPTAFLLLDLFVDRGFNLIDTADVYSKWATGNRGGESETVIGKWLAGSGRRKDVVIATKVGMEMPGVGTGLSRDHIVSSVEASLRRLQTDYIDLYQAHAEDPKTPIDETLEAFSRLIAAGKVKAIGASNYSRDSLQQALDASARSGLPRYETLQPGYNLYSREFEDELQPLCVEQGIGVIPYYGLASGFLTGKYRSEADFAQGARGDTVKKRYFNERGTKILAALDEVAKRHRAKPSQVALAWLMAQPSIAAPIASATTVAQLRELMASVDLALNADDLRTLSL
jgi:aryl-alcohol dehydrogenase-like predicted oxidoreductase